MNTKGKLIKKLFRGECSKADLEQLLRLMNNPTTPEELSVMEELWKQLADFKQLSNLQANRILQQTLSRIEGIDANPILKVASKNIRPQKAFTRRSIFKWCSVAAVLLFMIGIFNWFQPETSSHRIVQTGFGEQQTISLPDQSLVILNANSTLEYELIWDENATRKVILKGEAYFEVEKKQQTRQKFQVITEDLTVEVLGTVFNVNTRKKGTNVFLEEGKVNIAFKGQGENIIMEPGELVTFSATTKTSQIQRIEKASPSSWKDGTVTFKDTPLKEIIEKVEEIYGFEILVAEKEGLNRTFNMELPIDNFEFAFTILKEVTGLTLTKKEVPKDK